MTLPSKTSRRKPLRSQAAAKRCLDACAACSGALPPSAEVGGAARDVAALHLAAALAAAVPVPLVPPAGPPPGGNANAPRPVVADLYNSSALVFDPASAGELLLSAHALLAPLPQPLLAWLQRMAKHMHLPGQTCLMCHADDRSAQKKGARMWCASWDLQGGQHSQDRREAPGDHRPQEPADAVKYHCDVNTSMLSWGPSTPDSQAASAAAVGQAAGAAHLLAAAAHERRGAPGLAHAAALAHLACHAGNAPADERAAGLAQLAALAADRRGWRAAEQVFLRA